MARDLSFANLYTDFSGFAELRAKARSGAAEGARGAAEQVEALLLGMVIKSMRAGVGGGLTGAGAGVEQGLHDSQLALHLARSSRLGFAELMLREIAPASASATDAETATRPQGYPVPPRNPFVSWRPLAAAEPAAEPAATPASEPRVEPASAPAPDPGTAPATRGAASAAAAPSAAASRPTAVAASSTPAAAPVARASRSAAAPAGAWSSPEAFARDLWPAATRAAEALGTRPEAVLAVAALETGWGRHMPRREDGAPSYNLFGIKAHGWRGAVTRSPTLEFEGGAFQRRVEPFRAYDSPDAAFEDFVAFVRGQPRYRDALAVSADPVAFVHALHRAGYATDPRYGEKLESLLRGDTLARTRARVDSA